MNPKTMVWIARSLDRIARALVLIATAAIGDSTETTPVERADCRTLYREAFWAQEGVTQTDE